MKCPICGERRQKQGWELDLERRNLRAALQELQEWTSAAEEFLPHEIMCCTQDGGEWCDCARADLLAEKPVLAQEVLL